jgi:hypothetical protein
MYTALVSYYIQDGICGEDAGDVPRHWFVTSPALVCDIAGTGIKNNITGGDVDIPRHWSGKI